MDLKCFLMMQYRGPNQNKIFKQIENAVNHFSTMNEHRVELQRADLKAPLNIENLEQHLELYIEQCDFAIAEISQLNPNVLFEMGYAIGVGKPVIIMVQKQVKVPADFGGRLYFQYVTKELNLIPQKLQGFLEGAVDSIFAKRFRPRYTVQAYSTRTGSDLANQLIKAKEKVDILTTNLFSLVNAGHFKTIAVRVKSERGLKVRILTLDPESDFTAHRARQLGISTRHFREQLRSSLSKASQTLKDFPEECRIATYNEFPTQITFRVDDVIYYHVVSANNQSRNNILLSLNHLNAGVSESILSHFDTVWGRGDTYHRA